MKAKVGRGGGAVGRRRIQLSGFMQIRAQAKWQSLEREWAGGKVGGGSSWFTGEKEGKCANLCLPVCLLKVGRRSGGMAVICWFVRY